MEKQILDYIVKDVKMQCNRLGINAEFTTETRKNYRGEDYLVIKSTDFQMMPMIFHDIHVEGEVYIETAKEDARYDGITIRLGYKWTHFDGGTNGTEIGTLYYRVPKEYLPIRDDRDIRIIVSKVQGIQL